MQSANKVLYLIGDYDNNLLHVDSHSITAQFNDTIYSYGLVALITRLIRVTETSATLIDNIIYQILNESTALRHQKSPRFLPDRSLILTLVTKRSRSWSWMTYSHPLCSMSIGPPILRCSYFKIWPWESLVKAMRQRSRAHFTLKIQRSRSWPRSNPLVTFEA